MGSPPDEHVGQEPFRPASKQDKLRADYEDRQSELAAKQANLIHKFGEEFADKARAFVGTDDDATAKLAADFIAKRIALRGVEIEQIAPKDFTRRRASWFITASRRS
jgi:hypothetical protein